MDKLRPSLPGFAIVAGLSAFSSSCLIHKTPVVFTPPPPEAQPVRSAASPPPVLPAPPPVAGDPDANTPPDLALSIPELAAPPAPKPQPKKTIPPPAPKPAAPTAAEQQPQPPRLSQIFTPDQEREYNRVIDESLGKVKRALATLSGKRLNADQAEAANRIAEFEKQAEQAREAHDLANADLWAKRAATLADDLLTRVP